MPAPSILPDVWFAILAFVFWLYVVTDGFDLGIGLLALMEREEADRAALMAAIEPVWHANQTWLVIVGGVLFGAFPVAYGSLLTTYYVPAALLLFALMARGVGLEFHAQANNKRAMSLLFGLGSLLTIASLGLILGGLLSGGAFVANPTAWLNPAGLLSALGLAAVCGMLGSAFALMKTEGPLRDRIRSRARFFGLFVVLALGALAMALAYGPGQLLLAKWTGPRLPILAATLLAPIAVSLALYLRSLAKGPAHGPYVFASAAVLFVFVAVAASLYPLFAPPYLSIARAAAPTDMLRHMLYVVGPLLPILVWYNTFQYRAFKGGAYA